jgi:hypothetical protein
VATAWARVLCKDFNMGLCRRQWYAMSRSKRLALGASWSITLQYLHKLGCVVKVSPQLVSATLQSWKSGPAVNLPQDYGVDVEEASTHSRQLYCYRNEEGLAERVDGGVRADLSVPQCPKLTCS